MIFYIGLILCVVGVVMLVRLGIHSRRTKYEGTIKDLYKIPVKGDTVGLKLHVHAMVDFNDGENDRDGEILLKSKKSQLDDKVLVTVNPKDETKVEQYRPNQEIIASFVIFAIGVGFMAFSVTVMNAYNLW